MTGATATAQIADTLDTVKLELTAEPSVDEGKTITYTVKVSDPPRDTPLVIKLSNGAEVTIPVGATSAEVKVAAPADDVYQDPGKVDVGISSATGGSYEKLDTSATVSTSIADTVDTTTVSVTTTNVTEDAAGVTFHFQLSNPPQAGQPASLTVDVSGKSYTVNVDATGKGELFIDTRNADVYQDASSLTATVKEIVGGNFEQTSVTGATATAQIADTLDTTKVSVTTANVTENDLGVTFHFQLSNPPQAGHPASLTVEVGGKPYTVNVDATGKGDIFIETRDPDVYKDASSLTATVKEIVGGNFEKTSVTGATATAQIKDTVDTTTVSVTTADVTENDAGVTFHFQLSNPPQAGKPTSLKVDVGGKPYTVNVDATGKAELFINTQNADVYQDASSLTAKVTNIVGGNFEKTSVTGATATAQIADTQDEVRVTVDLQNYVPREDGGRVVGSLTLKDSHDVEVRAARDMWVEVKLPDGSVKTVLVPANASRASFDFRVNDDDVFKEEPDATARVEVVGVKGSETGPASIDGLGVGGFEKVVTGGTDSVKVRDDVDAATIKLKSLTPDAVSEDGGVIRYELSIVGADGNPVDTSKMTADVVITVEVGSQLQQITIPKGQNTVTYDYTVHRDDYIRESGDKLYAQIKSADTQGMAQFESVRLDTSLVRQDVQDDTDTVYLKVDSTGKVEESGEVAYKVILVDKDGNPVVVGKNVTVQLAWEGASDQFAGHLPASLTIPANQSSGTVTLTAKDDLYSESGKNLTLTVSPGANHGLEGLEIWKDSQAQGHDKATVTVTDESHPDASDTVYVRIHVDRNAVEEGASTEARYTVELVDRHGNPVAVPSGKDAITVQLDWGGHAGELTGAPSTITIQPGASSVTFNVGAVADGLPEGTERVTVTVGSVSQGSGAQQSFEVLEKGSSDSATIAIVESGNGVSVPLQGFVKVSIDTVKTTFDSVAEGGRLKYTFQLVDQDGNPLPLTQDPKAAVEVKWDDTLLGNAPGTVTFDATGKVVVYVDVKDDVFKEGSTVTAPELGSFTPGKLAVLDNWHTQPGSTAIPSVSITDEPSPFEDETTVTLTVDKGSVSEATDSVVTITATVDHAPKTDISLKLSTGETLIIKAGETSGSVSHTIVADEDVKADQHTLDIKVDQVVRDGGLEKLDTSHSIGVTVLDTTNAVRLVILGPETVTEGDTANYTFQLQDAAGKPVAAPGGLEFVVTLPDGSTQLVQIPAGQMQAATTFTAANDVYTGTPYGGEVRISDLSGAGAFEKLEEAGPLPVKGRDSETVVKVDLQAETAVQEGKPITYSVWVDEAPKGTSLVVTLSNGSVITVEPGKNYGSVTYPPGEDRYLDEVSLTVGITGTTGGGYEKLDITDQVTTRVFDSVDHTEVTLQGPASITEGEPIVYTVRLPVEAQHDVTVTLKLPDGTDGTVLIKAGSSSAEYSFDGKYDPAGDVYLDAQTVSASITKVEQANAGQPGAFEELGFRPDAVQTQVQDNSDEVKVTLAAPDAIVEGQLINYTVSLSAQAKQDVTVTLKLPDGSDETVVIKAGSSSAEYVFDGKYDPAGDVYLDAQTVSASITKVEQANAGQPGAFEELGFRPDAVQTQVQDNSDEVKVTLAAPDAIVEGQLINYTVSLSAQAKQDVTVTLKLPDGSDETVVIKAGSSSAEYSFDGKYDPAGDVYRDAQTVSASITGVEQANAGQPGAFERLVVNPGTVQTQVNDDADVTHLTIVPPTVTPVYTDAVDFRLHLDVAPQKDLVLEVSKLWNGTVIGTEAVTIPADQKDLPVPVQPQPDWKDGDNIALSVKVVSGGEQYESLLMPQPGETSVALLAHTLSGGAEVNVLTGGVGADILYGMDSNDTLEGRAGADWLDGGTGNDILTGSVGMDIPKGEVLDATQGSPVIDHGVQEGGRLDLRDLLTNLGYDKVDSLETLMAAVEIKNTGAGMEVDVLSKAADSAQGQVVQKIVLDHVSLQGSETQMIQQIIDQHLQQQSPAAG
ncbi:MAG: type I secretion C-terminal target domain-containing protein [Laribacter sp.]|nr:type I secretion C-terminal target domain-containing protein [Laribacter sp.]